MCSSTPTSIPTLEPNPIYYFVKDLLVEQDRTHRPLREITAERWAALSKSEACVFKHYVHRQYDCSCSCSEEASADSTLTGTLASSDTSLKKEMNMLAQFFGYEPADSRFTIFSSHVFHYSPYTQVIPAEIGLTVGSIKEGILESMHSLVDPGTIPVEQVIDALDYTDDVHRIPHRDQLYPNMATLCRSIHKMIHPETGIFSGCAWVFIEDDEFESTSAVLNWFEAKSTEQELGLEWNVHPIRLSSVWIYLKEHLDEPVYDECDQFAFKTSIYDYLDLCRFHKPIDHPNCALSKAHIYSYVLERKFAPKFGVDMIQGRHMPFQGAHWYF